MNKKQNSILDIDKLKYETYDNYIDSDLGWNKEIPSHFNIRKMKNITKNLNQFRCPVAAEKRKEGDIPYYGANGITSYVSGYTISNKRVILIGEDGAQFYEPWKGLSRIIEGKAWISNHAHILENSKELSLDYLNYYLLTNQYKDYITGSIILKLTQNNLSNIKTILPLKKEQLAIIKFLDSKTSQIDKKIELLENQNRLEEELEKSIINQCVTKGVDSFTKLDKNGNLIDFENKLNRNKEEFDLYMNENGYIDSEIEWLGFFPKNFNKKRLKELATFRRGSFPQPYDNEDFYDDINGKPFVQVGDVDNNHQLKNKTKQMISKKAEPYSVFVSKGNLIMTIQGSIGKIAITQYDAYIDRTLLIFKSIKNNIDKKFLVYFLEKLFFEEKKQAIGGTILTINKEKLSQFFICFPSKKEQLEIVKFLDSKTSQIKTSREKRSKEIKLLKEYKKTLINDVVTGKIKVIKD